MSSTNFMVLALISVSTFHLSIREGVSLMLSLVAIAADFSDSNASSPLPAAEEAASVLDELLNFLFLFPDPDPWLAKVLTVQERSKTARVWYYMKDVERPGENLYVPCYGTRQAQDVVSWDSILCHLSGEWRGDAWLSDM